MGDTPSYIKSLLMPNVSKPKGRKAWGIDLEGVWIPFFTATNTSGDTHLPPDALGCPLRLGYDADGSVKFSKTGRPIVKVAKDIADSVRMVRDNFTAGLLGYTEKVYSTDKAGFKAQLEMARKAGDPIKARDRANLDKAIAIAMEREVARAEAEAKAEATQEPKPEPKPDTKVPVHA